MTFALAPDRQSVSSHGDLAVRRQIDRSVSRALCDREYEARLLTDPTIALEETGCPPQQFKTLRSIHAIDVVDFARQAHALTATGAL